MGFLGLDRSLLQHKSFVRKWLQLASFSECCNLAAVHLFVDEFFRKSQQQRVRRVAGNLKRRQR